MKDTRVLLTVLPLTSHPQPLPTSRASAQQLSLGSGFLRTLLLGHQLTKPGVGWGQGGVQQTAAVPSLPVAVPLTKAFSVLDGKTVEHMA